METKDDLILTALKQLLRVSAMLAQSEDLPITVEEGRVVTTREAHTIEAVGQREGMTVTEAANLFGVTKSAASQMISKLCDKGYLDKTPSPHSNKEFRLSLTPLGRKAYQAHEDLHGKDREALIQRLRAYSIDQVATISVLLEAIGEVLDQRLS
jgi:DNA-binding MarR family transcriptional regulator